MFNDGTPRAMQTLEGVRVKAVALRRRSGRNPGSAAVSERPHSPGTNLVGADDSRQTLHGSCAGESPEEDPPRA